VRKLDARPGLRAQVLTGLRAGYSPDQVAGRLRHEHRLRGEHPGGHAERVADTVSPEAIYTWIYALPKGELAREGILLRSGRTGRRRRGRTRAPGARIVGMTSIDARPAEATDRAVPGNWEGDLVIG
jgi:IS30 family transposase